jgi:hypothetical protein
MLVLRFRVSTYLTFVDPCIIVQFIKKNLTKCKNVSKFYYSLFILSCCGWWTLSGTVCLTTSTKYTFNNLPRIKNQRLPVQF